MNMEFERKLAIPMEVKEMFPADEEIKKTFERNTKEIKDIFSGKDKRILLIVGPCSADSEDSVMDYIMRLRRIYENVKDKVYIVPRIYTNKPRTTGEGYKGLLHQPDPSGKPDMFNGIIATRKLHMRAVKESGFVCADELLYTENYKYLDDILGYVTVGARSVEDQQHRLTASGIDVPVGMKNPTGGRLNVMMNAINTAQHSHTFIYRGWEVVSKGNEYAHAILRGYEDKIGTLHPNYHYENLVLVSEMYEEMKLKNPSVIIDTNHANSGKNPFEQERIIKEVMYTRNDYPSIKKLVKGFMVESYIEDGSQKVGEGVYGKSITDACLGIEKTEKLIYEIAERV